MHQGEYLRTRSIGLALLAAVAWGSSVAAQSRDVGSGQILEPVVWQGPEFVAQLLPTGAGATTAPNPANPGEVPKVVTPNDVVVPPAPIPPQTITIPVPVPVPVQQGTTVEPNGRFVIPPAGQTPATPLLDDNSSTEELMPPVIDGGCYGAEEQTHVQPYGGGHPTDWSWGCGGSPYRTGPGICDNYKVGPRWHVTVDGIVMTRDETDLADILTTMPTSFPIGGASGIAGTPTLEQFDRGPGGRITFMSQVGRCRGWDMQCAYEGVPEWHSSIVYPIQNFDPVFFTPVITTTTTTATTTVGVAPNTTTTTQTTTTVTSAPGPIPLQPAAPFPDGLQQRSLHYTSQWHSGEMNFMRHENSLWRPYCGVRYIKFDDEINDFFNQEAQPPLPFAGGNPANGVFLAVATTDRLNIVDIQNNLMGFQIGLLHDTLDVTQRFAIEGFVNGGVYYNKVKFSNLQGVFTTQVTADDTDTVDIDESRTDFSDAIINDSRDYDEVSYVTEASISGVCRLNKCWALRAGYQVQWIANVHLADAAYLGDENSSEDLLFHGWHAGIECRR